MKIKYLGNNKTTVWKGTSSWVFGPNEIKEVPDCVGEDLLATGLWEKEEETPKFSFKKKGDDNSE